MAGRHTSTPGNDKPTSSRHSKRNSSAPTVPQTTHVDFPQPSFSLPLSASSTGRPSITTDQAAYLQRAVGNLAVARLLQRSSAARLPDLQRRNDHAPLESASGAAGGQLSSTLQREIQRAQSGGHALEAKTGAQMGKAFGRDFGGVKIHTDAKADFISRNLNAEAFTLGNDIFFRQNRYAPSTNSGQRLLAHELTHVVQQTGAPSTVQTKLTVGAAHDHYEQEADRVAQQVTKGLSTYSQGGQPQPESAPGIQRQSDTPVQVRLKSNDCGKITRSYEDRANAFEQSLGVYAFHHPKANQVAVEMSDHIRQYIEKKGKEDQLTEDKIDKLWLKSANSSTSIAGSVGENVETIKKVFTKGNLRERMTHIYNFMEGQFGNLNEDSPELTKIAKKPKKLTSQFNQFRELTGEKDAFYGDVMHKAAPTQNFLSEQHEIRQRSEEPSTSTRTVKDVGFEKEGGLLSKRELRHMYGKGGNVDKNELMDKQLVWSEGARVWKVNTNHKWVQVMQNINTPLMAGPSAHTNSFMNIAKLFGIKKLERVRLAAIGHLLPIRAHSLVEILEAAEAHGLPYTHGPEMYRTLSPLSTKELRNNVGNGSFPDEFGSPSTSDSSDYSKLQKKYSKVMNLYIVEPGQEDHPARLKALTELDQAANTHIAKKMTEKGKRKGNNKEVTRLDQRIKAVQEMRDQIKPKLDEERRINTKNQRLEHARKRIDELQQSKDYNDKLTHGTHSGLLSGLEKSKGTSLISAKVLEERGIVRSSGEGDFFSNGEVRGPKEFISVGLGPLGLGTALAYAQAAGTLPNYNVQLYKDEELELETTRLQEAIDHFDESLIDLSNTERDYKSKAQLQNLLDRLNNEIKARSGLPKDHPRRRGQLSDDSNFPLLFEFTGEGLDVRDDAGYAVRDKLSMENQTYNTELLGERMVYGGTIDLKPRLVRIYCPVDKIDEVTTRMTNILGHSNFEVLAMEALTELEQNTPIGGVRHETYAMTLDFEEVRKNVVSGYAHGMKHKKRINNPRELRKQYGTLPDPKGNKEVDDVTKNKPPVQQSPPTIKAPTQDTSKVSNNRDSAKQEDVDSLTQSLTGDGLRFHKIKGNGDCLFAAVIHQLGMQGVVYKSPMELRRALAAFMLQSSQHFKETVLAPIFDAENMTIEQAARRIQTPGYWSGLVGDTAPQLLASLLERKLILYRPDGGKQTIKPAGADSHPALSLVYNGTDHYDSTTPSGVQGPLVTTIPEKGSPAPIKVGMEPQKLEESTSPSIKESEPKTDVPKVSPPQENSPKENPSIEQLPKDVSVKQSVDTDVAHQVDVPRNLLGENMKTVPKPKKGKPRLVLSGHGLLRGTTKPSQTKVPSNMKITYTGPQGSILDNPLANLVESGQILPEDIFVEGVDLHTGNVTEIEPHEIMKLYKIFGPRTVSGGNKTPNYTLTPPKGLDVATNEQVYTVDREHTLAEIFTILRKAYPKGVDIFWAACQDLPDVDRRFQIKVMNVKDRYQGVIKRDTTSGQQRKEAIKLISKMIKEFKTL